MQTIEAAEAPPPFSNPEQELAHLRAQVAEKERQLAAMQESRPREEVIRERIIHHGAQPANFVLAKEYEIAPADVRTLALNLDPDDTDETIDELRGIMEEKGIRNALSVLEKMNSPHITDDFHRFLVQYIAAGMPVAGFSERAPEWKALHMTLYEVALPEPGAEEPQGGRAKTLKELISAMEQFYAGMLSVGTALPPARAGGAQAGDLYVKIHVKPHPIFRREGANLVMNLPLKLSDALLGTTVTVETLEGKQLEVKVPPMAKTEETLRVRERGIPAAHGRGDLLIHVSATLPKKLSSKAKKAIEELKSEGL